MVGIVRPVLPSPNVETSALRDRRVWEPHSETSNAGAVTQMCSIAKLKCDRKRLSRHSITIVDGRNFAQPQSVLGVDRFVLFQTNEFDFRRICLDGVIN